MNEFESGMVGYLESGADLSPAARKVRAFFKKNPRGPLRKRALKQMKAQADAIIAGADAGLFTASSYGQFGKIDWEKLIEMLGPILKLIISLFA